jgi:DNA (cytosine-5)-methyltransferase 1
MGYARAGFEITGVDVVRHQNNPHAVIVADALTLDPAWIAENFDAVHASPPSQGYTTMRHAPGAKGAPRLIGQTRELLQAAGLPWVIENVEAAAGEMRSPVLLCGTMFDLGAQGHDLQRHRLFETSFPVAPPQCRHTERPVIGCVRRARKKPKLKARRARDKGCLGRRPQSRRLKGARD